MILAESIVMLWASCDGLTSIKPSHTNPPIAAKKMISQKYPINLIIYNPLEVQKISEQGRQCNGVCVKYIARMTVLSNMMFMDVLTQIDFIKAALKEEGQSVVLVGLMGSGKSKLGAALAEAFDIPLLDSDEIFVKNHGEIGAYFESPGEDQFRIKERDIISTIVAGSPKIISTGGGAFLNDDTRALIKEKAVSVWLDIDPEISFQRMGEAGVAKRPLLSNSDNPFETLKSLYEKRAPIYGQCNVQAKLGGDKPDESKEASVRKNRDHVINALYNHLRAA